MLRDVTRYVPFLLLMTGACAPPAPREARPAPAAHVADERTTGATAARRRVAESERAVVEAQERVREAQLTYDALRDRSLMLRVSAAADDRRREAARAAARESKPYQALVTRLRDTAQAMEHHEGTSGAFRETLARLADLMQASEVRRPDAEENARWDRCLLQARDEARALRRRNDDDAVAVAAGAGAMVDAFVRVRWFWQDFDESRAAEGADEQEHLQARRELAEVSQLYRRASDELEDAKRTLREHETALSEARAASRRLRGSPR